MSIGFLQVFPKDCKGFQRNSTGMKSDFQKNYKGLSTGIPMAYKDSKGFQRDSKGMSKDFQNDSKGISKGTPRANNGDSQRLPKGVMKGCQRLPKVFPKVFLKRF